MLSASAAVRADKIPLLTADIPAQSLGAALAALASQTGMQLLYVSAVAGSQESPGAARGNSLPEALENILRGTGLQYELLNSRTIRIFEPPSRARTAAPSSPDRGQHAPAPDATVARLEELLVTAQRREQLVGATDTSIEVWTAEQMEAAGVKGMAQLAALTPGLHFQAQTNGGDDYTELTIRRVANRHSATTAVYMDDVAIPPGRTVTYMQSIPLTFDLDRVEVLNGPQGVLFGDHAQGGVVHFVSSMPSLTARSGLARGETSVTESGGSGYEAAAAFGGPLVADHVGLRLSGAYRREPGYVDHIDPFTGQIVEADSNWSIARVARAAMVLQSPDWLRISSTLTYQSISNHDTSTFYPGISSPPAGVLLNGSLVRQPFDDSFYVAALRGGATLDGLAVDGTAAIVNTTAHGVRDLSEQPPSGYGDAGRWYTSVYQHVYSYVVRVRSEQPQARLSWFSGLSATVNHEKYPESAIKFGETVSDDELQTDRREVTAFGQVTFAFTSRLSGTLGLRAGWSRYESHTSVPPAYEASSSESWTTPRYVLSYQPNPRTQFYASAAKGYGSGGVHPGFLLSPNAYPSDSLWSYEVGASVTGATGRWNGSAHLFRMQWDNGPPQVGQFSDTLTIPGKAYSQGFELSAAGALGSAATATLDVSYTNARCTETLWLEGFMTSQRGDALHGPPWRLSASLDWQLLRRGNFGMRLHIDDSYQSGSSGQLFTDHYPYYDPAAHDPAGNLLNVRIESAWDHFTVTGFISNAFNARPVYAEELYGEPAAVTGKPRTLGLQVAWHYQ